MNDKATIEPPREANTPEVQKITQSALQVAEGLGNYQITTAQEFHDSADMLRKIKAARAEVDEQRFAITRPMDDAKKRVMSFFGQFTSRLDAAETNIKRAIGQYTAEQERIQKEQARIERERVEREQARLREEARKADEAAAAKERQRLAELQRKADERAKAERERIAKEMAAAKDAEAKRRAEEQAKAQAEREQREQERLHQERLKAEADARERSARAAVLEDRANSAIAAPATVAAPKAKGITTSKRWTFEIVDKALIPDQYKTIDEKKIRGVVNALKEDADIPGVRIYQETVVGARRAS